MATARKKPATRKPARAATARKPARAAARKPARAAARKAKPARKPAATRKPVAKRATSRAAGARRTSAARTTTRKPVRKPAPKAARRAPAPKPAAPPPSNPVVWYEIPVQDMTRAMAFYERVLQVPMRLQDMGHFQMAWFPGFPNGLGATGTLMKSDGYTPSHQGSLVYFSVKDIEGTLGRVRTAGGRVLNPKMSIGEFGFVAHFEDSEGNRIALHGRS